MSETNKYEEYVRAKTGPLQQYSKMHQWKPCTNEQMKAFIGLIINMGLMKKPTTESYFSTTPVQDTPIFRETFKLTTFKNLLRFFHASDSELEPKKGQVGYDPTYKFNHILEFLTQSWQRNFQPGRDLSIDERPCRVQGPPHPSELYKE